MSPLRRQSTIFLQSRLTEEHNSGPFWVDGAITSAFRDDTFGLLESAAIPFEDSPALPTEYLLPSFDDDHLGPPSASSGDYERVDSVGFTLDACTMPFGNQSDDLFDHTYQAVYTELFQTDDTPCILAPAMTNYELSPPTACDILSVTHLPPAPIDPSTMTAYAPYFDHGCNSSQVTPTPDNANVVSPPPSTPSASSPCYDTSESDGEGDVDYVPPSDDDEEYCPIQTTSPRRQKKRGTPSQPKSPYREESSPTRSTSSESEKSVSTSRVQKRPHPYKRCNTSRNFQREGGVMLIDKESDFQCPVVGCDYVQKNQRIPDLKRHVSTHDRWMEPDKWTCCGVGMDRAYLYGKGIKEGMTEEECIEAGAYMFGGRLMIGGCMKTFARRDALKRHVDNPNISCVGHMETYYP